MQQISELLHKGAATTNVLRFFISPQTAGLCVLQVIFTKRSHASCAWTVDLFSSDSPASAAASSSLQTHSGANVVLIFELQVDKDFEQNCSWVVSASAEAELAWVVLPGSWLILQRSRGYFLPHNALSSPVSLYFQAGPLPLLGHCSWVTWWLSPDQECGATSCAAYCF